MTDNMRDYMRRRDRDIDERNPYGSRGGYVSSDRYPEYPEHYERHMDRAYGHDRYPHVNAQHLGYEDHRRVSFRGDIGEPEHRYHDMRYDEMPRHYSRDFGGGFLSNNELREWQNALCKHMDQQECEVLGYEKIIAQAEQMAIKFDKYTKEEFYTAVLMMFTDFYKTIGANIPMYISLAKDFLEDDDAKVRYGEKLACYHDTIANV